MLKRLLDKEAFTALPEVLQKEYKPGEDDTYTLDAEESDTSALKRAKDHEKTARQSVEKELREYKEAEAGKIADAEEVARKAAFKEARSGKDIEALDKSWEEKYSALLKEKDGKIGELNSAVTHERVTSAAARIANEITIDGAATLLQPIIEKRLTVEMVDGKFNTRVLDAEGKPSALSLKELQAEFVNNTEFKGVIKGGKAKGGGATNQNGGGASKKFNEHSAAELSKLRQESPEQYTALKATRDAEQGSKLAVN